MAENLTQTESIFGARSLVESGLKSRPSIQDVWIELFDQLPKNSLICVSGNTNDGKSLICQEIMARVMAINNGHSEAEILFCEIDQHFRISTLAGFLSHRQIDPTINRDNLLDKLTYQSFDSQHSFKTFLKDIKNEIRSNANISVVVVDCFGSFFVPTAFSNYQPAFGSSHRTFFNQILEQFQIMSKYYRVTFVYTQPHYFQFRFEDRFSDYWIDIENRRVKSENPRRMKIKHRKTGELRQADFIISNYGIEISNVEKLELEEDDRKISQESSSLSG